MNLLGVKQNRHHPRILSDESTFGEFFLKDFSYNSGYARPEIINVSVKIYNFF